MPNPLREIGSVVRQVWTHPSNRGKRVRQLGTAIAYQLRGRILRKPTLARLGQKSLVLVDLHSTAGSRAVYANPPDHHEMRYWSTLLRRGDLFVDVGANVGIYSLWAAECGAEVIAIEPDPLAASRLRRNAQLNGYDITVIEAAVGESNGTANFTVGRDAMNAYAMDGDSVSRSVNVVTLDSVLAGRHARGVKIDVEGAERLVIVGSRAALGDRRIDYLQIEWNGMSQVLLNETREPTAELLCESGYELYRLDGQDDPNADMFARAVPRSS